jgi:NAD(P)-dependent dehydrogenase (short-subunit alcohol dehydrogenase family)
MKMAAVELAEHGIRVNAVAPGTIETDLNREMLADPEMRATLLSDVLLGRPGSPEDIGGAVAYLVSDRAKHVTGATLAVTGGSLIT